MNEVRELLAGGQVAAVLAHQGGWDEIALIAGPIIVIAGLLVLAKRRVDAVAEQQPAADPSSAPEKQSESES